jgi:hypothetical protein
MAAAAKHGSLRQPRGGLQGDQLKAEEQKWDDDECDSQRGDHHQCSLLEIDTANPLAETG